MSLIFLVHVARRISLRMSSLKGCHVERSYGGTARETKGKNGLRDVF